MAKKKDGKRARKRNHLISRRKFREFVENHSGTERDADTFWHWCKIVEQATWFKFADVKATFGNADLVGAFVVFNVGGNKYRVLASISFSNDKPAMVFIKHVLTHKEYDNLQ